MRLNKGGKIMKSTSHGENITVSLGPVSLGLDGYVILV